MAAADVNFHADAEAEVLAAAEWYAEQNPLAAAAFGAELDRAVIEIQEAPRRWRRHLHGTRHYLLQRFPYSLIYREVDEENVQIVAVAHGSRRPGYWKGRS